MIMKTKNVFLISHIPFSDFRSTANRHVETSSVSKFERFFTAFIWPLLYRDGGAYEDAYMITNAVLKGLQAYIENLFGKISIEN